LRAELAVELRVPPEHVTLQALYECTTGEPSAEIRRFRRRFAEISAEVSRLNRQNAAIIRQSLDVTTAILGQLTGTTPDAESYNAAGARDETRFGSVVQWGG
ncbi:MAG: flagellar export chaperone FlgN, partial [Planctomycetales bacterium]|nr:flagellar export chaperone FlgN [Planctomycetales bacterium]